VPEEEKRRRLHVVNAHQQQWQRRRHEGRVGSVEEVLVESVDGEGRVSGRSRHFRIVHLDGAADLVGRTVAAEITGAGPNALRGRLLQAIH
jgi:tRNA A37 methylthiotransferase MiaB